MDPRATELSAAERERYARHLILPEVGAEGQVRLKAAKVLLVGAGGLGSPAAIYLAAAGVGTLGIVDFDAVDETNLQRQILYGASDVGRPKLESAAARIRELNPHVRVVPHETRLSAANALEILRGYDIVLDGTDNFPTRYLVNDACVMLGKTNVYGSIFRFEGQASVFSVPEGPCYRCLFPEPPPAGLVPSCAEGGVLGILPGIVGCIQATETVKRILGRGDLLIGRLLLLDALSMRFRELKVRRDPACPLCGKSPAIRRLADTAPTCAPVPVPEITAAELARLLDAGEPVALIDVREPAEHAERAIPGARLIPLGELPQRIGEIPAGRRILVHCKAGGRSRKACEILISRGISDVASVAGGIDAWEALDDRS